MANLSIVCYVVLTNLNVEESTFHMAFTLSNTALSAGSCLRISSDPGIVREKNLLIYTNEDAFQIAP